MSMQFIEEANISKKLTSNGNAYRDAIARALLQPKEKDLVDAVDRLLKPCPFCKVGGGHLRVLQDSEGYRGQIGVCCTDCGGAYLGDEITLDSETVLDFTIAQIREVADGWNNR